VRGLPPPPADCIHLTQFVDTGARQSTISWWLYNANNHLLLPADLKTIISDYFSTCIQPLLSCMHQGASLTTCRASILGLSVLEVAPTNIGEWAGGQADNVASGWKWETAQRGRAGWALTYLPAVPDIFIKDNQELSPVGWGNLLASAEDFRNLMNQLTAGVGYQQTIGTVHRSLGGTPLGSSTFAPYVGVTPTAKVVTIRRRIRRASQVSPFP
jgi:hypothetical protein